MVKVVWNEGQHFGTVQEKLDSFSTFGVEDGLVEFRWCVSGDLPLRPPRRAQRSQRRAVGRDLRGEERCCLRKRPGWGNFPQGLKPAPFLGILRHDCSHALTRFVAGLEKAARSHPVTPTAGVPGAPVSAWIPGLKIEPPASPANIDPRGSAPAFIRWPPV